MALTLRSGVALSFALALLLTACGGGGEMQMPPAEVSVATVVAKPVAGWDEYTGRIEAIDQAEVRPRVGGPITGVHFREGGTVAKGDLLFTIDDREYRAAAESARADVARAQARLALAGTELTRSEGLIAARAVSAGELEGRQNESKQAEADVMAARARLQQAELSLSFTRVTAPIAGRVGVAQIREGNLVAPGEPVLTRIVSLDPVFVSFRGDESAYLRYQSASTAGMRGDAGDEGDRVRVGLSNEDGFPHEGRIAFIDNAIDPATGTILLRAELANPDGRLTPGLFARVQLMGTAARDALLVHPQAVLTDQDRRYVYVAGQVSPPDGGPAYLGAVRKDVVLGRNVDGLVVVESGLAEGDQVVVNGLRRIFFPGAPIVPSEVPMDAPLTAVAPAPAPATAPSEG